MAILAKQGEVTRGRFHLSVCAELSDDRVQVCPEGRGMVRGVATMCPHSAMWDPESGFHAAILQNVMFWHVSVMPLISNYYIVS